MAKIFVCRDHALDPLLDDVTAAFMNKGEEVIRGPKSEPGQKIIYRTEDYPRYFNEIDVAVFSSRSVVPGSLMCAANKLRGIVYPSIGVETLDLQAANSLGIIVGHGAISQNTESMAEACVMLMLNLRYNLRQTERVMQGLEPRPPSRPDMMHAGMLRGTTIGMIGLGRIAKATVERLRGFNVRLVAYSPSAKQDQAPHGVQLLDLQQLLVESDMVCVLATANECNKRMINAQLLDLMKPTAYLINISRGDLIDEAALIKALQKRRIAGAALDVFTVEPLPLDSPLRQLDNVILTPHLVGHTRELIEAIASTTIENVLRVVAGSLPLHCKNPEIEPLWRQRMEQIRLA